MKRPARPRDFAQLARLVVDMATGNAPRDSEAMPENRKARSGRLGGLRGGKARAAALSPRRRKAIAKKAAAARWKGRVG
jgi:hypothetical protein